MRQLHNNMSECRNQYFTNTNLQPLLIGMHEHQHVGGSKSLQDMTAYYTSMNWYNITQQCPVTATSRSGFRISEVRDCAVQRNLHKLAQFTFMNLSNHLHNHIFLSYYQLYLCVKLVYIKQFVDGVHPFINFKRVCNITSLSTWHKVNQLDKF
jgi:hypothetical protein